MTRPVDSRINRSGYGQLSETDQVPSPADARLDDRDPARTAVPPEQSPGYGHLTPDRPSYVHPALEMEVTA